VNEVRTKDAIYRSHAWKTHVPLTEEFYQTEDEAIVRAIIYQATEYEIYKQVNPKDILRIDHNDLRFHLQIDDPATGVPLEAPIRWAFVKSTVYIREGAPLP